VISKHIPIPNTFSEPVFMPSMSIKGSAQR
jgi:hypothetical protein